MRHMTVHNQSANHKRYLCVFTPRLQAEQSTQAIIESDKTLDATTRQASDSQSPRIPEKTTSGERNPQLLIFLVGLLGVPPLTYYYWQYREAHMRAKKKDMLRELQARLAPKT